MTFENKTTMKKFLSYAMIGALALSTTSCHDWLTEETPGVSTRDAYFATAETGIEVVNAAYAPLMWEYGPTYYPEWFIGDVVSDDALKGGQSVTSDMGDVYDMENFKTNTDNKLLLGFYRAQWQGIARCNLALDELEKIPMSADYTPALKKRLTGEARFVRAYYYFRLLRIFGGMPLVTDVIDSNSKWKQTRATRDATFRFILDDLEAADTLLIKKSEYAVEDAGRATIGAADAMLCKVWLYRAGFLAQGDESVDGATVEQCYQQARTWGKKVIESGEYGLTPTYAAIFTLAEENGIESVFDIQYTEDPMSDYGEGEGFTRGTFTTILQRPRTTAFGESGWGFDKPSQDLYDEFETNMATTTATRDVRRANSILTPTDAQIQNEEQEIYLGTRHCARKYNMMSDGPGGAMYHLTHATRGPANSRQIRYADVLLMYAEACIELNDLDPAVEAINQVRNRASNRLPKFPYTTYIRGQVVKLEKNQADMRTALRHERRCELAMEGHRWFDLCRWGIAAETMEAYFAGETEECRSHVSPFIKGKHELFPIPSEEITLSGISQNNGW